MVTILNKVKQQRKAASWRRVAGELLALSLSGLFAMAAGTKVVKYATYRSYLHTSGLMGEGAAFWLSFMLPAAELLVAGLLVWSSTRRTGLFAAIALLPFYHYYLFYVLNNAPFIPCGCLGVLPITWEQHYILNIIVLLISVAALVLDYRTQRHRPIVNKRGSPVKAVPR